MKHALVIRTEHRNINDDFQKLLISSDEVVMLAYMPVSVDA